MGERVDRERPGDERHLAVAAPEHAEPALELAVCGLVCHGGASTGRQSQFVDTHFSGRHESICKYETNGQGEQAAAGPAGHNDRSFAQVAARAHADVFVSVSVQNAAHVLLRVLVGPRPSHAKVV